MGACLSSPATQEDPTAWQDVEARGGVRPPPAKPAKDQKVGQNAGPTGGTPAGGAPPVTGDSPPPVPPLERRNTKGSSESDELGHSMGGSIRRFLHLPGKPGEVAPRQGQGQGLGEGSELTDVGKGGPEGQPNRHRPAWEAASLGRGRGAVPRAATDGARFNDGAAYSDRMGFGGGVGFGDSQPGLVTAGSLQMQGPGLGMGLGMGTQGMEMGTDTRDPHETLSLRPRGTGHVAAQGPLLPIMGGLPHSSSQNALAPDSWQTAGQGGMEAYALPRPFPDRGVSVMSSHGSGRVHSGSVHGFGGRYGGATRGLGGDEGSMGGGGMMGAQGMPGSTSIHGGMGTGSLHGGSGRPSSVALRYARALHRVCLRGCPRAEEALD